MQYGNEKHKEYIIYLRIMNIIYVYETESWYVYSLGWPLTYAPPPLASKILG